MGLFSLEHTWVFPSNNNGQLFGINDSGVETFNGTPIKSLAREICQNSIDASLSNEQPTFVEFQVFEVAPKDIPNVEGLQDAFERCLQFQPFDKAKTFFKRALGVLQGRKITCLRISDHNTTGLTGSREEYYSPWCNLVKSTGSSDKSGSNGGSFGIGKYAPFACSAFRTVFYSTNDVDGIVAYQGVSRLTSFKAKGDEITQGIGFYGNKRNTPVSDQLSLDPSYQRDKADYGTDIFVLGFTGGDDWQQKMIASVLDGFLYAVFTGKLVVNVNGTLISKDTLPELVISHKSYFEEYADEYYRTLTDEKAAQTFETDISEGKGRITGRVTLQLMIMPEFHRRVAMVRQTGMKIKDKGNINGLIPFAGVLYIDGSSLNSYLRNLENPQHLEWEIERADNKAEAKRLLGSLTKFIKRSLDELKDDDSKEELDPSVGEYLSAEQVETPQEKNPTENINDTIKTISIRENPVHPKPAESQATGAGSTEVDNPNGDIVVTDIPGEGGRDGRSTGGGNGGSGGGHGNGTGGGDTPVEHRKSLSAIAPAKVRVFCRNKVAGKYTITFTPALSAQNGTIVLYMSAESQSYDASIIFASCVSCPSLRFSSNCIEGLIFEEKVPITIEITLDYHDYCSMEVKAYGNKV